MASGKTKGAQLLKKVVIRTEVFLTFYFETSTYFMDNVKGPGYLIG